MAKKISAQEIKWQAEEDARTMARYQEIISDSSRKIRAIKTAEKEAKELEKRANVMKKVVKTKK